MTTLDEIADLIGRHAPGDGFHAAALPRVNLIRSSTPTEPIHTVYKPALCLVAQGRKRADLAGHSYEYDAAKFLVLSLDLLVVGTVTEASPERPYLCLALDLDLPTLSSLMIEHGIGPGPEPEDGRAIHLTAVEPSMLDAVLRLLRLLDSPADAAGAGAARRARDPLPPAAQRPGVDGPSRRGGRKPVAPGEPRHRVDQGQLRPAL